MLVVALSMAEMLQHASSIDEPHIVVGMFNPDTMNNEYVDYPKNKHRLGELKIAISDSGRVDFTQDANSIMFNREHAMQIKEFVTKYENHIELIVVHCQAGISRSGGLAAALTYHYNNGNNYYYFSNKSRYVPNSLVYDEMMKVLCDDN